ncbi:MAG: family 10 glycosylhydrolase [Anaerocolumna sp.]
MMKTSNMQRLSGFIIFIIAGIFLFGSVHVDAAQDKTNPTISLKADTKEPTNKSINIEVKASGIKTLKWATGSKTASYFKKSGKSIKLNTKNIYSVTVTQNGTYSFYTVDKAGNDELKKITISNIDTTKPALKITKSTKDITNGNVSLSFIIGEKGLGIQSLKYLIGQKTEADFLKAGKSINLAETAITKEIYNFQYSGKLTVKTNNTFTFLVEDTAGNKILKTVTVENIDKTSPIAVSALSTTKPTKNPVTVNLTVTDDGSGVQDVKYLTGIKTAADFVTTDQSQSPTLVKLDTNGKGSFKVSKNGKYTVMVTDNVGNQSLLTVAVTNIDIAKPTLSLNYSVINQKATITYNAKDTTSGILSIKYLKGKVTDLTSAKWDTAKDVTEDGKFIVTSSGDYSVLAVDTAGNQIIQTASVELEFKAVWISYLEYMNYGKGGFTEASFKSAIDTMFDNVVKMNMNAVVVQVRPFGDAMYNSSYFPWSKYASGTQGVDPGFDPLEYMVEAAHERGLQFHAWLNPYRVTTASTDYSQLSKDNPARVWHDDKDKTNNRNVLSYAGNLYYNPASKEVQTLITNGVKEIVKNYDVDGIHFDDYFYPSLGSNYANNFDSAEYKTYVSECKTNNKTALSIADWRRNNVNTLVKNIYASIKKIDSSVQFGISPGGFYNSLTSNLGYYVDYKTWLSSDKYIDYICPQIYWTFSNKSYPFDKTLDKWLSFRTSSTVKMYVGIATYKAGSSLESDWKNNVDELKEQVEYSRDTGLVDGFVFFRYDFFNNKTTKAGVDKLLSIMK